MAAEAMEGKSALELLAMGSKAYWARNYSDAAAYLSKSSEMLVEEHKDDKHNSLGNVYLYYGKSLLELAREDGDPLGDAVPKEVGVEDGSLSDDEEEMVEGEEAEPKDSESKTEKKEDANISMNGEAVNGDDSKAEDADESKAEEDESVVEEGDESKVEEGDESKVEEDDEEEEVAEEGTAEEGTSGEKEDEEPTDLQLAWEVLELGKIILERRGDDGRQDFADCLVTLGEVSLESENFDSAIADINAGLEIQKVIYTESKDMRKLAETYYKLGMALSAHNKIDEGIGNYKTTLDILKDRLKVLEAIESPGSSDNEEIKDIKNLIPELEDKISDLNNYKEEMNRKPEEEPPTVSSPEKKVNNISHLVKRKRKLQDVVEETSANAAKKSQ